jgi:hypothetical protein
MKRTTLIFLSLIITFSAFSQDGLIKFGDPVPDNEKTKVMVLATPHLAQFKEGFRPSCLDSIITMFRYWQPYTIAVESQPGRIVDMMINEGYNYNLVVQQFEGKTTNLGNMAREKLGISGSDARHMVDSLVVKAEEGYDIDKSDLILKMLAAYDYYSALLQWAYLTKLQQDELMLPEDVKQHFTRALMDINEINTIGIRVAMESRVERIYQIDDHQDKDLFINFSDELMDEISVTNAYQEVVNSDLYRSSDAKLMDGLRRNNLMPYYRYLNSPAYLQKDYDTQWMMFYKANLSSGLDKSRVALWENRNMNIASNIRRISAMDPGGRVLVIIGASHKPFLDLYLSQMLDIKVVQFEEVYKDYLD